MENTKYNWIFFLVIILLSEQSYILTCWIPSKIPRHANRNKNSDLFLFSQPKSQPCSKITLKHQEIWGSFSDTDRNPDNLEHIGQNWLTNIYRQVGDNHTFPGLKVLSRLWSDIRRRHLKWNASPLPVKSIYLHNSDATSKFLNTHWTTDLFSLNKMVGEGSRVALRGRRRTQQ